MHILVTGGTGFIGSELVKGLKGKDVSVIALDGGRGVIKKDIRDPGIEVGRYGIVYHLAAVSSSSATKRDLKAAWDINVNGTLNIASKLGKGQHLVFMSSGDVYSPVKGSRHREDDALEPVTFYGITKKFGEELIKWYSAKNGFTYTILRLFNVYGESQPQGFVVPDIIRKYREEKVVEVRNPRSIRDFVHVEDAVAILLKAESIRGIYNVGSGRDTRIREVYDIVKRLTGSTKEEKVVDEIADYIVADNSKIKDEGFRFSKLEENLKRMV